MENVQQTLKVDNSIKGIILLTLPISISRLIPELNLLFNSIFLGHLGTKELAQSALTGVYYLIFAAIGYGVTNSILSMISKQAGENERFNIISTVRHGYIVSLGLFLIGIFFTFVFLKPTLYAVGIDKLDADIVYSFSAIRIWGLPFLFAYQLSNSYLICIQETKWLLIGSIVESLANIIFDYWFIFGGFGIQSMGFNGAAYASVLSEIIGFSTVLFVIFYKKFSLKYDIPTKWKYTKSLLIEVLKQASPLMVQFAISIIAWWIFYIILNRNYSYEDQAASQTMRNLFGISGVFSWAFGSTTNTMISNLIGQKKYVEIFPTLRKILAISLSGMFAFIVLINIFPEFVFFIFGQKQAFLNVGTSILRVVSCAMLLLTAGCIFLNATVATGQSMYPLISETFAITFYLIYVVIVAEILQLPSYVAWMSEWIYWSTILFLSYYFFSKWHGKQRLN